ncbi:MAG: tetratricopeptide repeat protein [Planctomycetota bacterium]
MGMRTCDSGKERRAGSILSVLFALLLSCAAPTSDPRDDRAASPVIDKSPAHDELAGDLFLRAVIQYQRGNVEEALQLASHVVELDPEKKEAYLLRAQCWLESGDDATAVQELETCGRLDPEWSLPYRVLGGHQLECRQFGRAVDSFTAATRLDPAEASSWNGLGLAWTGCAGEMRSAWRSAGGEKTTRRMLLKARRAFTRAMLADRDWVEPRFNRAVVAAALGEPDEALGCLQPLVQHHGQEGIWLQRLALATSGLAHPGTTAWYLHRSLERLTPEDLEEQASVARRIAFTLVRGGELQAARPYVEMRLGLQPRDTEARLWLADIQTAAGEPDLAAESYRAVFEASDIGLAERALIGLAVLVEQHGDPSLAFELMKGGYRAGLRSPRLLALLSALAEEQGERGVALASFAALVGEGMRTPELLDDTVYLRSLAVRLVRSQLDAVTNLDRACEVLAAIAELNAASAESFARIEAARKLDDDPVRRRQILDDLLERFPVTPGGVELVARP